MCLSGDWLFGGPMRFHMNFRMSFSTSAKKNSHWDFDRECNDSVDCFVVTISSLLIHEHEMVFRLFVYLLISFSDVL